MKYIFIVLTRIGVLFIAFLVLLWEFSFSEASDFVEANDWDSFQGEEKLIYSVLGLIVIGVGVGIWCWRSSIKESPNPAKFEAEYAEMLKHPATAPAKQPPLEKP